MIKKSLQLLLDQSNVNTVPLPTGITRAQFNALSAKIRSVIGSTLQSEYPANFGQTAMVAKVSKFIAEGKKVVIVGHGLGAWIANSIYDALTAG